MTTEAGDPGAWKRLGEMLIRRRIELDPAYRNRGAFCAATGLDYRLVYDIEEARRTNFGKTTLTAIETGYRLPPGTIGHALAGGDLDKMTASPDQAPREGVHDYAANESIPPERLRPYLATVRRDLAAATVRYGPSYSGAQAFTAPAEQVVWDMDAPAAVREQVIAIYRYYAANGTQANGEESGTGLCRAKFAFAAPVVTIRTR